MARNYSVVGSNTASAAPQSLIGLLSGTGARPRIFDIVVGSHATPADTAVQYTLTRFTAAGTSTAYTPLPLDAGDVAAIAVAGVTHTVEPTYTATGNLLWIPLNLRATFRYVASPGAEFVGTAGAATGMGFRLLTGGSSLVSDGTVLFFE